MQKAQGKLGRRLMEPTSWLRVIFLTANVLNDGGCINKTWIFLNSLCVTRGAFLEGPEKFSHPESRMITAQLAQALLGTVNMTFGVAAL